MYISFLWYRGQERSMQAMCEKCLEVICLHRWWGSPRYRKFKGLLCVTTILSCENGLAPHPTLRATFPGSKWASCFYYVAREREAWFSDAFQCLAMSQYRRASGSRLDSILSPLRTLSSSEGVKASPWGEAVCGADWWGVITKLRILTKCAVT